MKRCSVPLLMLSFFIAFLAIIALAGQVTAATPNIVFNSKNPSDINSTNLLPHGLNITYNISGANLNTSSIKVYLRTNTSTNDCIFHINGTATCGFQPHSATMNISKTWYFEIMHMYIYPGVYNFNQFLMKSISKLQYSLSAITYYAKVQLLNVSNKDDYNYLFLNAQNTSTTTNDLRIYYCNSSYTSGDPSSDYNCGNFYNLPDTTSYSTTYPNSKYYLIPFPINSSTGRIDGIKVSNTSYFLFRGRPAPNYWQIAYISNISRPGAAQYSTNSGNSWTNLAGTFDVHLHQFSSTDTLYYYACANDTSGNQNCTSTRSDLLDLAGIPPDSPIIHSPTAGNYSGNITINYSKAQSPNDYAISYYNITLANITDSYVKTIKSNNSLNLNYTWNSTSVPDGNYNIHIKVCDVNDECSLGESDNFRIDNTPPKITVNSPTASIYGSNPITFKISSNEGLSYCWYTLNNWTTNSSLSEVSPTIFRTTQNIANGLYTTKFLCEDYAGNTNSSQGISFGVSVSSSSTSSLGGGGGIVVLQMGKISNEGKTIALTVNKEANFEVLNETHSLRITKIDAINKTAEMTVSSNQISFSLKENESKNIDLNNDSKYDITVTLLNVTSDSQAKIKITNYITPVNAPSEVKNATSSNQTPTTSEPKPSVPTLKWNPKWDTYIGVIIASCLLTIVILTLIKKTRLFRRNTKNKSKRDYKNYKIKYVFV